MKRLHINDMTLDNDLGIANYSNSIQKLLMVFRTSNPLLLVPKFTAYNNYNYNVIMCWLVNWK